MKNEKKCVESSPVSVHIPPNERHKTHQDRRDRRGIHGEDVPGVAVDTKHSTRSTLPDKKTN